MLDFNALKKLVRERVAFIRSPRFQDLVELQLELRPHLQGIPYWTAAVVVGIVAVVYSSVFTECIELARSLVLTRPLYMFLLAPACFVLATWVVEHYAPAAGGTGIPSVIRALGMDASQTTQIDELLNLRVATVIVASSLLCVLGGGALGREGPMIHLAACLFYFVGRQFHRIFAYQEHRSWIVAGGAAGIAAAFNAPLAGVVFVLEELAQQHFHQFKTAVITAAIIAGAVSQWISGRYLFLGYPQIGAVPLSSIAWAVGLSIICGIAAVPFHRMLRPEFQTQFSKIFNTRMRFAIFVGLCMAALSVFVSPEIAGGGIHLIDELLFSENVHATWGIIGGRFIGTILSHLSGCAGGFLAPALSLGAAIGSKFAILTDYPNHNLLVMVGMAAFLSAIIRAPFTAWVIVMEMTDRHSAIFPLMVAALISSGTLRIFEERKRVEAKTQDPPKDI